MVQVLLLHVTRGGAWRRDARVAARGTISLFCSSLLSSTSSPFPHIRHTVAPGARRLHVEKNEKFIKFSHLHESGICFPKRDREGKGRGRERGRSTRRHYKRQSTERIPVRDQLRIRSCFRIVVVGKKKAKKRHHILQNLRQQKQREGIKEKNGY